MDNELHFQLGSSRAFTLYLVHSWLTQDYSTSSFGELMLIALKLLPVSSKADPITEKIMCKLLVTLCFIVTHNTLTSCQYLKCSENFCLPLDYDKGDLPPRNKNQPLQVAVEFEIIHFSRIQDKEFWMEVVMWLALYWDEPRLKFIGNGKPRKLVSLGLDFYEHIWVPDLYVYSLRNIKMPSMLTQFAGIASLYGK